MLLPVFLVVLAVEVSLSELHLLIVMHRVLLAKICQFGFRFDVSHIVKFISIPLAFDWSCGDCWTSIRRCIGGRAQQSAVMTGHGKTLRLSGGSHYARQGVGDWPEG